MVCLFFLPILSEWQPYKLNFCVLMCPKLNYVICQESILQGFVEMLSEDTSLLSVKAGVARMMFILLRWTLAYQDW